MHYYNIISWLLAEVKWDKRSSSLKESFSLGSSQLLPGGKTYRENAVHEDAVGSVDEWDSAKIQGRRNETKGGHNFLQKLEVKCYLWVIFSKFFLKIDKKIICKKLRRGPKLEGCAFANFGNSSGTEEEVSPKRVKIGRKKNQCCRDWESNPGPVDN